MPRQKRTGLKPYNDRAGYVGSRRNYYAGGFNVLYHCKEAQIDDAGGAWACVCETHGTIANFSSRSAAYKHLALADWCEACMNLNQPEATNV